MQKFLNTELGRSLVEMLGVLAIIGVLSIASIAGYSYAITKWKASEVLSDLHTRAIEYTRQMAMQKKFAPDFQFNNFDLGDENSLGNPVAGFPLFDDSDYFEIEVRGVSAEVCEQIIRDFAMPIIDVAVNDGDWGAVEEDCRVETPNDMVTMTFLFSKYLEGVMTSIYAGTRTGTGTGYVTVIEPLCQEGEYRAEVSDTNAHIHHFCCPIGSDGWGWNVNRCCTSDEILVHFAYCCPSGSTDYASAENKCCASGESVSNGHCCPANSGYGGWGENVNRCCTTEEKRSSAYDAERKTQSYCCPSASDGWGVNVNRCCDADQGEKRYNNFDSSLNAWNYFCCPSNGGTGGWGRNVQRCCTAEETRVYDNQYGRYHCCPTGQTWDSTTKRCVGGGTNQCATNDDCLPNEFCAYPNATSCTVKPTTGVCQPASVSHTKKINGKTYKRSSDDMNFWSAENFCARIGGSMVSVSDFQCGYDFVANKNTGYCNTGTGTAYEDTRSDTMKLFMSGLGNNNIWLTDDYTTCYSYFIHISTGHIYYHSRHDNSGYYALCKINEVLP